MANINKNDFKTKSIVPENKLPILFTKKLEIEPIILFKFRLILILSENLFVRLSILLFIKSRFIPL